MLAFGPMNGALTSLVSTLLVGFRSRLALQAEILALRHQLNVLQRSTDARRRLRTSDRILWVWLSQLWSDWRSALLIVKPETVIRWHRQGFRLYWRWKSRHPGRPDAGREIRELIRKMCVSNPTWGAPRIQGELLKLGFGVSEGTISRHLRRLSRPDDAAIDGLPSFAQSSQTRVRLQAQTFRHHKDLEQTEYPLGEQSQKGRRHGPFQDEPDVIEADAGQYRLPVTACADERAVS